MLVIKFSNNVHSIKPRGQMCPHMGKEKLTCLCCINWLCAWNKKGYFGEMTRHYQNRIMLRKCNGKKNQWK